MDYTKLTIAELANGVNKTETAIRRCREILDDLQEPSRQWSRRYAICCPSSKKI